MSVEAFIFDIGNVLVRFEHGRAERSWEALGGAIRDRAAVGELARAYERGAVDRTEFLARLPGLLAAPVPREALVRSWQRIFTPNLPMWDLVEQLHGRYPLYLLSNTNCLHHEHLVEEYPVFGRFADGVFSYRVGMMKPERGIFGRAIRQFGVRPEATVYIDDLAPNVEAARGCGLRAVVYHPEAHGDLIASLRAMGVQCV